MDDFDRELESIELTIQDDFESRALRRRFEQSKEWEDHRRWHSENGGTPVLRVWEEDVPAQPVITVIKEDLPEIQHRKAIKVGGCDCQPRFAFMELTDKGDVVTAGIPSAEAAAQVYGTAPSPTTPYGAAPGPSESIYNTSTEQKDLYR